MPSILFLHGLESTVDADLLPIGRKMQWLRAHTDAVGAALDTRAAVAIARRLRDAARYPFDGYEEAFATPLARAKECITPDTRVIIGSSFGGAVLMRLIHETSAWAGPCVFLAGAGVKLTPHRTLPAGQRCLLVHGTEDSIVPHADSELLASTSDDATLWSLKDGHTLASITVDGTLDRAIQWALL